MNNDFIQFLDVFAKIAAFVAVVYALGKVLHYILHYKEKQNEEYTASFNAIITQLSSNNQSSQLSAAILLRRFFDEKGEKGRKSLKDETINVMSSLLRVLPTGILQKTLGDGLAYAKDLSNSDLQKQICRTFIWVRKKTE